MKSLLFFVSITALAIACGDSKFTGDANAVKPAPSSGEAVPDPANDIKTIDGINNTPNTVVFGGSGVYRVGDGAAQSTSCQQTVFSFELEGSEYSFSFNVEQDSTTIKFLIGRLCGIDSDQSNIFSVVNLDTGKKIESARFNRDVVDDKDELLSPLSSALVLNKGKYAVRIVSEEKQGPGSDRDDFVVGNIKLQADKPILGTHIETR